MATESEIMNSVFDSTNNLLKTSSGGDVASGAADTGNPVKVAGVFNTTAPTVTTGQRVDLQMTNRGEAKVALYSGTQNLNVQTDTNSDGVTAATICLTTVARPYVYNGSTFDKIRGNQEVTLLSSAARTTTQTGADITNYNGNASLVVVLDVTSAGTGSVTLSIEGKDSASGKYYTLLSGAAVTTNSTNRYRVTPHLAAAANSIAQDILPRIFRIVVTANNANSMTYSVGYCLIRD